VRSSEGEEETKETGGSTLGNEVIIGIAAGVGAVLLASIAGVFFFAKRRKRTNKSNDGEDGVELPGSLQLLENVELVERLGGGHFGDV
jgi:hypothetical protein